MSWTDELSEDARANLPEDLTENETLNRYKNVGELAKAVLEQKSLISQSLGRMPSEEAGPEARQKWLNEVTQKAPELVLRPGIGDGGEQPDEFWRLAGKPEKVEDYQKPEGVDLPPEVESHLRETMFKANATQQQFEQMLNEFGAMHASNMKQAEEAREQGLKDLAGKWGMTTEQRMEAAKKVHEEYFKDAMPFDQLPPEVIEGLYKVNESLGKDPGTQAGGQPKGETGQLTPAEAEARIAEIMQNKAYWDRSDPQNRALIDKVMELRRMTGAGGTINDLRAPGI